MVVACGVIFNSIVFYSWAKAMFQLNVGISHEAAVHKLLTRSAVQRRPP
jgi:hypothetical protein